MKFPSLKRRPRSAAATDVDPAEAARRVERGDVLLLDVREPDEWSAGHAPDAVHVPLGQLDPGRLPQGRPVVAVCRSGNRSGKAALQLRAAGVEVHNLTGGMKAWAAAGLPVTTDDGRSGTVA